MLESVNTYFIPLTHPTETTQKIVDSETASVLRSLAMSDYNGPSKRCKVRLLASYPRLRPGPEQLPAGTILNAIIYDVGMNVHIELPDGRKWFQIAPEDVEEIVSEKFVPVNKFPVAQSRKERQEQLAAVCQTATEFVRVEAFGKIFTTKAEFKRHLATMSKADVKAWRRDTRQHARSAA